MCAQPELLQFRRSPSKKGSVGGVLPGENGGLRILVEANLFCQTILNATEEPCSLRSAALARGVSIHSCIED